MKSGMMERLWTLDNAFHRELFRIARKTQTYDMVSSFTVHFDRVRNMALTAVKDTKIVSDHRLITQAIERHDEAGAKALMAKHLERYKIDQRPASGYPMDYFKQAQ